jgi:polar amino acid transport system substrate-binding protein
MNATIRRLAGTAAMVLVLAAPTAADARTLQQVLNQGQLRVGVVLAAPWTMRGPDRELIGFEIDVARKLAADMKVRVEFVVYDWARLVPAVESGEIDIVAAGLTITPERALHVNFSQPYASGGVSLATRLASTASVGRLEELNDEEFELAAVAGTAAAELARRILPRAALELFESPELASGALVAGEVDGYLEDEPIPTFLALEHPGVIDVPIGRPLLETKTAFAVAKGDADFLAFLDAWVVAHDADTWLATTQQYWFKSLRWRE